MDQELERYQGPSLGCKWDLAAAVAESDRTGIELGYVALATQVFDQLKEVKESVAAAAQERAQVIRLETRHLVRRARQNAPLLAVANRVDNMLMDDRLVECVSVGYTYKKILGRIATSKKEASHVLFEMKKDLEDPFKTMSTRLTTSTSGAFCRARLKSWRVSSRITCARS